MFKNLESTLKIYDESISYLAEPSIIEEWENLKTQLRNISASNTPVNEKNQEYKNISRDYISKLYNIKNNPNALDDVDDITIEQYIEFYKMVLEMFGYDDYILENTINEEIKKNNIQKKNSINGFTVLLLDSHNCLVPIKLYEQVFGKKDNIIKKHIENSDYVLVNQDAVQYMKNITSYTPIYIYKYYRKVNINSDNINDLISILTNLSEDQKKNLSENISQELSTVLTHLKEMTKNENKTKTTKL